MIRTVGELVRLYLSRGRWYFLPLVLVLLAASALLVATTGLGWVAPFVYAIF